MDEYRSQSGETFTGAAAQHTLDLESRKFSYGEFGSSLTKTHYREEGNTVSLTSDEQGEENHGAYPGISYRRWSWESFKANPPVQQSG